VVGRESVLTALLAVVGREWAVVDERCLAERFRGAGFAGMASLRAGRGETARPGWLCPISSDADGRAAVGSFVGGGGSAGRE